MIVHTFKMCTGDAGPEQSLVLLSLKIANSADPDEMLLYEAFHQGLHCLPKYPFISTVNVLKLRTLKNNYFPRCL